MIPFIVLAGGLLDAGMFFLVVSMHATRKTSLLLTLYAIQSILVACLFIVTGIEQSSPFLYIMAGVTVLSKVLLVPILYRRLIHRLDTRFASGTYLKTPATFIALFAIAVLSFSVVHTSSTVGTLFATISPALGYAPLHLAGLLATLFLAMNRKEAFSQVIALLALENWVVYVATFAGFHQTLALEMAITLETVVLAFISVFFLTLVHERFGSLDISKMTHLSESDE